MQHSKDVIMTEGNVESTSSILHIGQSESSGNTYLVKLPQWLSDVISNSPPGTEIGYSHAVGELLNKNSLSSSDSHRLVLTSDFQGHMTSKPKEYGMSLPNNLQNLRILDTDGSTTFASKVSATFHMIPKRDEKYAAILKDRLMNAESTKQHRTIHDEQRLEGTRGSTKLFQRVTDADHASRDFVDRLAAASPESAPSSTRSLGKKLRSLDELPQKESKAISSASLQAKSVDDIIMEILVRKDTGWPLMQLSKAVKEAGGTIQAAQLKMKLLDICVYQRRDEDQHPKYYLKNEFK